MADVASLDDRRYWPTAQDAWAGGWPTYGPDATDVIIDAWRASMRRLAHRLGVPIRTTIHRGRHHARPVATANHGYPLDIRTPEQRDAWDALCAARAAEDAR